MNEAASVSLELRADPDFSSVFWTIYCSVHCCIRSGSVCGILVMRKNGHRQGRTRQNSQHQTRSTHGTDPGAAAAILSPSLPNKSVGKKSRNMEEPEVIGGRGPEDHQPDPRELGAASDAITRPILEAIDASKAAVMVRIDHVATECTLIRHDIDKFRGRLTEAEGRISEVEDVAHTHGAQLRELWGQVDSLQRRADDAEDRQRRNNVRGMVLSEGA